jgi:repressor LexA
MPRTLDLAGRLRELRAFVRREGRLPSYAELAALWGYRSKHAVTWVVNRLVGQGALRRGEGGRLAAGPGFAGSVRLLGSVQAGFPSPAEEELVDTLSLDQYLIEKPEATYLLTVSGDSMIEAGIHPGDLVLVEKGTAPKNNDIVVAQVDDEWTLKYFVKDADGVRLEPANRKYKSIRPKRNLVIGGIVRAVVRKYG